MVTERIHVHNEGDGDALERITVQVSKRNKDFLERMTKHKVFRSRSHGADLCIHMMRHVYERYPEEMQEKVAAMMGLRKP